MGFGGVGGVACLIGGPLDAAVGPICGVQSVTFNLKTDFLPIEGPLASVNEQRIVPAPVVLRSVACLVPDLAPGCGGPVEARNVWEMFGTAKPYKDDSPGGTACLVPGLGPGFDGRITGCLGPVDGPCLVPEDRGRGGPGGTACLVLDLVVGG